jgi:hypothetical protein
VTILTLTVLALAGMMLLRFALTSERLVWATTGFVLWVFVLGIFIAVLRTGILAP